MQALKALFSAATTTGSSTFSATPVQIICNYNDNYYGDQVCTCAKPAGGA